MKTIKKKVLNDLNYFAYANNFDMWPLNKLSEDDLIKLHTF